MKVEALGMWSKGKLLHIILRQNTAFAEESSSRVVPDINNYRGATEFLGTYHGKTRTAMFAKCHIETLAIDCECR